MSIESSLNQYLLFIVVSGALSTLSLDGMVTVTMTLVSIVVGFFVFMTDLGATEYSTL